MSLRDGKICVSEESQHSYAFSLSVSRTIENFSQNKYYVQATKMQFSAAQSS